MKSCFYKSLLFLSYLFILSSIHSVTASTLTQPIGNDDSYTIDEDNSLTIIDPLLGLLSNDTDPDGGILSVTLTPVLLPAHGTVTLNSDGTFDYIPDPNYNGLETFQYELCNNAGSPECSIATVTITINAVNDAPIAIADIAAPNAIEDTPYTGATVLSNDSDPDAGDLLSVTAVPVIAPNFGGVTFNTDGTYLYTPIPNYFGADVFSYQVCDNGSPALCAVTTVSVNINPVPDPPTLGDDFYSTNEDITLNGSSLLTNDLDFDSQLLVLNTSPITAPTHGSLTISPTGTFTYIPNANYFGADSFVYEVCDNGLPSECSQATAFITISAINDAPVAAADSYSINEDILLNGTGLLSNDSDPEGNSLIITTTPNVAPLHGTLNLNANGTFSYNPVANYNGTDSFVYQVCDNGIPSLCTTATVSLTITSVNDAPVANNDNAVVNEDIVLNGPTVLSNDNDIDGNALTVNTSPLLAPSHGNLILNSNGTYTYTPAANYNGADNFTYQVCDNGTPSLCSSANVAITIAAVADAPVASNDNYATSEDALLNGTSVLANDIDGDGELLTVNTTPISNVTHGLLVLNSDGTFIYIPATNYNGSDSFVYQVCDGTSLCATATAIISISAVNDAPVAVNDIASVNEDVALSGASVLLNDSDPDGNILTVTTTPISAPTHGSLTLNSNGTYTYTPVANYNGSDSFIYQVCDNAIPSSCSNATVTITINPINDNPSATADNFSINEDIVLNGTSLLINDSDIDGNLLTINTTPVTNPTNGSLTINANGTFTYTPNLNFNGTDSFVYRVCDNGTPSLCSTANVTITITPVNDAPLALNDISTTAEDTPLSGTTVLSNDSDPEGNSLTVSTLPITPPTHGTVNINSNGTYLYTPALNYNGSDSFVYQVCDNAAPALCSSATVTITISAVNDAPLAVTDAYSTNEDTPLNAASVLINDTDVDGNPLTLNPTPLTQPLHGTLTLNADGTFIYTPQLNYNGSDAFTYQICDNALPALCSTGQVNLTVISVNDAPIAVSGNYSTSEDVTLSGSSVLGNDSDPDGNTLIANTTPVVNVSSGSLTLNADGTFIYVPAPNFNGTVSFTYQVCDNVVPALCATAITTINVIAVNDAPTLTSDSYSTNEDTPLNGTSVLVNDFDVENNTITVSTTPFSAPLNGLLALNANGTFTYTPDANYFGSDSFVYQVCDNGTPSQCAVATVNLTVVSINDTPIANSDNGTTLQNIVLNGTSVLANDVDPENGTLTISTTPVVNVAHGTLVINSNGTYTYTPNLNYNGFDSFVYRICDNGTPVACATATVTISIGAVNQFPIAVNDVIATNEDTPNSDNVLTNDSDPDLNTLTVTALTNFPTLHGKITIAANGAYTYTPNLNYFGPDNYTYQVCDNGSPNLCSNATINITVNPVNDAPLAVNDNASTPEDTPLNGSSLLINDSDVDGNLLSVSASPLVPPAHGSLTLNANGTYLYTPVLNYVGGDTFVYEVCDNGSPSACSNAVVLITITPVNDAPTATNDSYTTNEDVVLIGSTVLVNDLDEDGNSLTVTGVAITPPLHGNLLLNANGTFIYTPAANYSGTDSFVYQVCDNGIPSLCSNATVSITINAVNDAPSASNDNATTAEDTPLSGSSVLTNDSDVDGNSLIINTTPAVNPIHGTVIIQGNGTYIYTPNLNYNGSDSFIYQVCDNGTPVLCTTATVTLTITAVNDGPVALADAATTNEDTPLNGTTVLSNDSDPDGNPLSVVLIPLTAPLHGNLSLNANGTYSYVPNLNYNGSDSFVYQVCDNASPVLCASATVSLTITAINDAPLANNDIYSATEDTPLNGSSLNANDSDPEGGILVINTVPVTNPIHGSLTINPNGSFLYTSNSNYNGTDSFVYQVCDAGIPVACSTATATINIASVNDAPQAIDDNASTLEDTPFTGTNLLLNDSDPDGNPLTINTIPVVNPTNGTVVINANGTYTYTPNTGFSGFDSFEYQVCDNQIPPLCDNAIVTIGIGAVNHAPTATNDLFTTAESTALNTTVAVNDADPDGNNLIYTTAAIVSPSFGNVTINSNGTFNYIPNTGFSGSDSFTYQVCDDGTPSLCATATVTINVTPVNDAPLAIVDIVTTTEDTPLIGFSLVANDSDPDGNQLAISTTPVATTSNGTLTIFANGTFNYTPNANFNGFDSFVYQLCDNGTPSLCDTALVKINVTAINDKPNAVNDNASALMNTIINGNVGTNDADIDGPSLTFSILTNVANGTLILNTNGSFTYTPNLNFIGNDSLLYSVCDGGSPNLCDTALLRITITAVPNSAPNAVSDNYTVNEDATLTASTSILANDSDPDANVLTLNTIPIVLPTNGTLSLNTNGTFTYTPNTNFNGTDSFVYRICDDGTPSLCDTALVLINVISINDAPLALDDSTSTLMNQPVSGNVILNDTDADGPNLSVSLLTQPIHGQISLNANGTFTYTPNAGYVGSDSFMYNVCDGGSPNLCAVATVTIQVNALPPNQAPLAIGEFISTAEDIQISGSLSGNDSDPEFSTLIYTAYSGPTLHGTIAISASGNFIYVPTLNYFGPDSYIYTVCDTGSPILCDTALINISISSVNDAPLGINDSAVILQGAMASGNLLTNDSDVDGNNLTASILVLPINGVAAVNANGSYTYTPNANFVGTDIFSYLLCDGGSPNLCDTALVVITVNAPACAGYLANPDLAFTSEDFQVIISELANDNAVLSNLLVGISANPSNGNVVINANNSLTYTPNPNFFGTDTLIYSIGRAIGSPQVCDTAMVIITVAPINDAPFAINDIYTTTIGTPLTANVTQNDTDIDSPSLAVTLLNPPSNGNLALNPNGSFTYTPNAGYTGPDSFTYLLCDGAIPNLCDTATVNIGVIGQACAGFIANPDTATLNEDGTISIFVLNNDSSILNHVGITILSTTANGTLQINANNSITYIPNPNFNGFESFIYAISDTTLPFPTPCDTALVKIKIMAVNDSPEANADHFPTIESQVLSTTVLANDYEPDGDSLTATLVNSTQNGTLIFNSNGSFSYTPNALFTGIDSFVYTLCDTATPPLCDTALVTITVLKLNRPPFAQDDTASVNQGETVSKNVLINDTDPDLSDLLSVSLISQAPLHGSVSIALDGNYSYTADDIYFGLDSFAYEVCDDNTAMKQCDIAVVRITIIETPITVPNAFSPDGDNINDKFIIKRIQTFPNNELQVYNRWGQLVYQKTSYDNSWDGKSNVGTDNSALPSGSYFYIVHFNDGISETKQGYVVLRK